MWTLGEKVKNLINDLPTDHFFQQGSNRDLLFLQCLKGTQCIQGHKGSKYNGQNVLFMLQQVRLLAIH